MILEIIVYSLFFILGLSIWSFAGIFLLASVDRYTFNKFIAGIFLLLSGPLVWIMWMNDKEH